MGRTAIRGGRLLDPAAGIDLVGDLWIRDGVVERAGPSAPAPAGAEVVDATGALVTPAFLDLHAHLREPGGEESETIATGTAAALAGGFATVYAMPNTDPTADRPEVLARVRAAAAAAGPCEVVPVSAITVGLRGRELVDLAANAAAGAGAFSDDGAWVADEGLADRLFREAAEHDWLVMQHCEDFALTGAGVLHDAAATRSAGLAGIPRRSEDEATARDVALARRHGARLHLCHVSTRGAVALLREAKAAGARVTGEATPHHLVLTVDDAVRGGPDFKMKPPLREAEDVAALVAALRDGTVDACGTDHAPHAEARKALGLSRAPFGVVGLETAFPVLHTRLVLSGALPLARLVECLTSGPARAAGRPAASLRPGSSARVNVVDVATPRRVDRARLLSRSRNTPFHGWVLTGWPVLTVIGECPIRHDPPPPA
jgi:dihydroorotase